VVEHVKSPGFDFLQKRACEDRKRERDREREGGRERYGIRLLDFIF
jgi:hypothetical protein